MDLSAWSRRNQLALAHLEEHLLHWQEVLLVQEPRLQRHATAKPLQASLSRHPDLSRRTLTLLEEQRVLLARLEAQLARRGGSRVCFTLCASAASAPSGLNVLTTMVTTTPPIKAEQRHPLPQAERRTQPLIN